MDTIINNGRESYAVWELQFEENGGITITVGYIYSEITTQHKGTWKLAYKSGRYVLTIICESYRCECYVNIEGDKLKLEKIFENDISKTKVLL